MMRRARLIVGSVLLAATVNVAVAIERAARSGPAVFDPLRTAQLRRRQFEAVAPGAAEPWIDGAFRARGLEVILLRPAESVPIVGAYRCGWPMLALEGGTRAPSRRDWWAVPMARQVRLEYLARTKLSVMIARRLPLRPMWPGFAVNTALYATVLLLLVILPRLARRAARRFRGACPACGYDLRGDRLGGCPECGRLRGDVAGSAGR